MSAPQTIRVLALIEAAAVTGPAKNLLGFCQWTRSQEAAALGLDIAISIATYSRKHKESNSFIQGARAAGIPMYVIPERFRFDRSVVPQIANLVERLQPDVVQTHNVKSHFLFRISGVRKSVTWLAFQHGYTDTDWKMRLYNQLDRYSLRSAERVVTVCRGFVPKLLGYGVDASRIRILHNSAKPVIAVSDSDTQQLRQRFGFRPEDKIILTIGRFSKEKGHADLLKALGNLHGATLDQSWKALLVGEGPERVNLERLAAQLGLTDRLVFTGFQSDVAPFYAIADAFVLPSHSEGSPNVLLEAMSSRVPVAATHVGGVPEIVSDEQSALLVPAHDPERIQQVLRRLLQDSSLGIRLADAAFKRVCEVFSPGQYRQTLVEIYLDALKSGRSLVPAVDDPADERANPV